jgi:hypothetical protein
MKRVTIFILGMLVFSGAMMAQEEAAEWRFGLKAQPSVSWLSTTLNEFENGQARMNFGYGLMVEKSIFKSTVIASGLFINDYGANFKYVGQDRLVNFYEKNDSVLFESRSFRVRYVEVPVLLKFRTPEINYITYSAHFGLNLGFRARALGDDQFRDIRGGNTVGTFDNQDISNDISFLKATLDVGLGAEYSIAGSTALLVGVSYQNGFSNFARKKSELLRYRGADKEGLKQVFFGRAIVLNVGILF